MVAERALDLAQKAAAVFAERSFENPRLEAELLLAGVLGMKRLDLYLQHDRPLDAGELDRFRSCVRRRLRREPLQYILGRAPFRHLELQVDARVLIPRPETEVLAGLVLSWYAAAGRTGAALDIGTGSGAIALSLATEATFERVAATDVSQDALNVAAANVAKYDAGERVELRHGALFEPLRPDERFTVMVSNPPYVAEGDALPADVRDYEPHGALFAGAGGLDVIERLVDGAPAWLEAGGLLALEIGLGQADAVLERMRATEQYAHERVEQDLTGRPRFVLAERKSA